MKKLFFWEGRLFLIASDEYGAYLESWNEDGSDYRKIGQLWDKDRSFIGFTESNAGYAIVYEGYLYYYFSEDYEVYQIKRIALEQGKEPELLTTIEPKGNEAAAVRLTMYEDILYITCETDWGTEFISYSLQTKEKHILWEQEHFNLNGTSCYVRNGFLYYCSMWANVVKQDLSSGEEEILLTLPAFIEKDGERKGISYAFWSDGVYLYIQKKWSSNNEPITVQVLDFEGNKIDSLTLCYADFTEVYDAGNYLLVQSNVNPMTGKEEGELERILYRYDKRQIGTDYAWWEKME